MSYSKMQMQVLKKRLSGSKYEHLQRIISNEEKLVYGDYNQVELLREVTNILGEYYLDDVQEIEKITEKIENIDSQIEEYEMEIDCMESEIGSHQAKIKDLKDAKALLEKDL